MKNCTSPLPASPSWASLRAFPRAKDGKIEVARVGVTGLGPKAFRAEGVEKALQGKKASEKVFADAAKFAAQGIDALSDLHASAEFRGEMAIVHARRALARAFVRAQGKA